jgi:hypothetical protein
MELQRSHVPQKNPVELVSCPENYVPLDNQSDITSVKLRHE